MVLQLIELVRGFLYEMIKTRHSHVEKKLLHIILLKIKPHIPKCICIPMTSLDIL